MCSTECPHSHRMRAGAGNPVRATRCGHAWYSINTCLVLTTRCAIRVLRPLLSHLLSQLPPTPPSSPPSTAGTAPAAVRATGDTASGPARRVAGGVIRDPRSVDPSRLSPTHPAPSHLPSHPATQPRINPPVTHQPAHLLTHPPTISHAALTHPLSPLTHSLHPLTPSPHSPIQGPCLLRARLTDPAGRAAAERFFSAAAGKPLKLQGAEGQPFPAETAEGHAKDREPPCDRISRNEP